MSLSDVVLRRAASVPQLSMLLCLCGPGFTIYSKMFIGGLNWDTTDGTYIAINFLYRSVALNRLLFHVIESLRNYFSQFGKVDACTIMRDAAGRSRCFAFLTFEDPASVNAVMVREHFLDGKIVRPPLVFLQHGFPRRSWSSCAFIINRLTQNEQYRARNTSVLPSYSSVACLAASRLNP